MNKLIERGKECGAVFDRYVCSVCSSVRGASVESDLLAGESPNFIDYVYV